MSEHIRKHPYLFAAVTLCTVAVVSTACWLIIALSSPNRVEARSLYPEPTARQVENTLLRLGITPEALAAAGADDDTVEAVIGAVDLSLQSNLTQLTTADSSFASALAARDALQRLIRAGKSSAEGMAAAESALTNARTTRDAILSEVLESVNEMLEPAQQAVLASIRTNSGRVGDARFLTLSRSDAQWVELRDALTHERIATGRNEEVDGGVAAFLVIERERAQTTTAAANLTTYLAQANTAWTASLQAID